MDKPKVSILLPAYNHEKFVGDTIESVLGQTFQNFELLISDDCSTDDTAHVIQRYQDDRITRVFFEENQGTVRALNHLLSIAKGEYIAVIGSDDVWEQDKLQQQLEVLDKNPNIAACFSWASIIDQNSQEVKGNSEFPLNIFNVKNESKSELLRRLYVSGNCFCHSSVLIRNSVHQTIGEYNVAYRQLHDFDLWVRLLLDYDVHIIERPLVKYRYVVSSGNVSQATSNNNFRMYNEGDAIIRYFFEHITCEDFKECFSDLCVSKNICSENQVICEKFLLLRDRNLWEKDNTALAMRFLFEHLNEEVLRCFEYEYSISLNDLYEYTQKYSATYGADVFYDLIKARNEINALNRKIDEIYASNSWKITKPLRSLTNMLKKIRGV